MSKPKKNQNSFEVKRHTILATLMFIGAVLLIIFKQAYLWGIVLGILANIVYVIAKYFEIKDDDNV